MPLPAGPPAGSLDSITTAQPSPAPTVPLPGVPAPLPRKSGRPKGSKNKYRKAPVVFIGPQRRRGRPTGTKRKAHEIDGAEHPEAVVKRPRGRPKIVDSGPAVTIEIGRTVCILPLSLHL